MKKSRSMVAAAVAIAGLLGWLARMGWAASEVEVRQKQNKAAAPVRSGVHGDRHPARARTR